MTRAKVMSKLYKMAMALTKKFDRDEYDKMWTLCCDWNSAHEDEEIFMCEDYDEDDRFRFFVEDDYFYPAE